MDLINKAKDKIRRHKERHTSLEGIHYLFSDSINFINPHDWDKIAADKTIFSSRQYLQTIENYSPNNTTQRYAIAYSDRTPVAIVACQVAEISGEQLHELYLNVEQKSKTRLATLPSGYFFGLSESLRGNFCCYGIIQNETVLGFISVIKDREDAVAYYVGFDYAANDEFPIYFRLLQLVIEAAISMHCKRVLFGRSALEPKAGLGAKPVDEFIWARHRVPVVNFFVRKLFRNVPFDEAPHRTVFKSDKDTNK